MDKKKLNNEIILCRPAVRKAKVIVIRKILRKMKILKACNVEAMKQKKLRKSERLFEKVQIIKGVKVDEVTKFALRHNDLKAFLKGPNLDLRQNALACLALHEAVMKRVNLIKEQIPNWEVELPLLLDSLGKKKESKMNKNKKEVDKINNKNESIVTGYKSSNFKNNVMKKDNSIKKKVKILEKEKATNATGKSNKNFMARSEDTSKSEESDCSGSDNVSDSGTEEQRVEKIDDPFFIEKKVIAPKLVLESLPGENKINKVQKPFMQKEGLNSLHKSPFKPRREVNKFESKITTSEPVQEVLHPSWAAKKVKLIKPFQGKKIKFSDD